MSSICFLKQSLMCQQSPVHYGCCHAMYCICIVSPSEWIPLTFWVSFLLIVIYSVSYSHNPYFSGDLNYLSTSPKCMNYLICVVFYVLNSFLLVKFYDLWFSFCILIFPLIVVQLNLVSISCIAIPSCSFFSFFKYLILSYKGTSTRMTQ